MLAILLLVVALLAAANSQSLRIPNVDLRASLSSDGNSISYLARFGVNTSATDISGFPPNAHFRLDFNAPFVTLSLSSCRRDKVGLWALTTGDGAESVPAYSETFLGNFNIRCRRNAQNVAALNPQSTSLPAQMSRIRKLPFRFGYLMRGDGGGTLFFGKKKWDVFVSVLPVEVRANLSFVRFPLKVAMDGKTPSYMAKLTGIGFQTFLIRQKEYVEISTTQRFTTLPPKMYNFVVGQFQHQANERNVRQAATSAFNGRLTRCYKMRSADLTGLRNVTMVFQSESRIEMEHFRGQIYGGEARGEQCLLLGVLARRYGRDWDFAAGRPCPGF